jgi:hypothetical protein
MQALIRARLPAAALLIAIAGGACSSGPEPAPLQLDGGILTVDNRTDQDWEQVEIWVNQYYRAAPKTIRARTRFTAPLRVFVSGWGQTFPYGKQQIWDIRLTATQADGTPVEHNFRFEKSRLEDALGGNP